MKILLLSLLFLLSCKTPSTENFNPLDSYLDFSLDGGKSLLNVSAEYMEVLNGHRASLGLVGFIENDEIAKEAQTHAENMAQGSSPFGIAGYEERCARIKLALGQGSNCGELVARGPSSVAEVLGLWMESDSGRSKLQSIKYTHSAIGLAKSKEGKEYWVQIFIEIP